MQEITKDSSMFKLLKIPLPVMLLLFGLYAWTFLVAVETFRSVYRRIRGVQCRAVFFSASLSGSIDGASYNYRQNL